MTDKLINFKNFKLLKTDKKPFDSFLIDNKKREFIKKCFRDGEEDYKNGLCVDGKAFMKSL